MGSLVSVIIPVFNKLHTVGETIQSALGLRYRPIEIVIVDDGSRDGSYEKMLSWKERYPEVIKVFKHEGHGHRGPGASRNLGIRKSNGTYVCFLDADDLLLPDRLSKAAEILDSNENVDCVFESARVELRTAKGAKEWMNRSEIWSVPVESGVDPGVLILKKQSFWCMDSILCRRQLLEQVGGFSEWLRVGEDRVTWLKMALIAQLSSGCLDKPVSIVRRADEHTWSPSKIRDTYRDIWSTAVVFFWAKLNRIRIEQERNEALKIGFRDQILRSLRIMREEGCCWRAFAISITALLVPSVLRERIFWGNLVYGFTDKLFASKRKRGTQV